jgi:beta-mannosidase
MSTRTHVPRRWSLDGTWTLRHLLETDRPPRNPHDLNSLELDRIPAAVPGNVELDLQHAGVLHDPFVGLNAESLRPYEFHQWWYERDVATPELEAGDRIELVFEGLDCFATVWLNGECIGETANAMIAHRFDVTKLLEPAGQNNRLTVRLRSPINAVRNMPLDARDRAQPQGLDSLRARKPPHCYGWDIAPRIVSAGIWRPVYLEQHRPTELEDVFFRVHRASEESAQLTLSYRFRTDVTVLDGFEIRARGSCGESTFDVTASAPFTQGHIGFTVSSPRLWWPRGYGDANLYDTTVELRYRGEVVSTISYPVGIRTVALERTDLNTRDHAGRFVFIVNSVPIFAKGSNWVPLDAFHSRDAGRIPAVLELFADVGCNMVRCWGGNVYEPHLFYAICDREGILVWQDFAMACAAYPQDEDFLAMMRQEAEWVVRELRRHPCIALWAGDNECDVGYLGWWGRRSDPAENRITREVLPQVIRRLDPDRDYLPSSPYIAPAVYGRGGGQELAPEQHLWGPRDYYKSAFYADNTACFASEMGYHGCPGVSSVQRFISDDSLWPWQDNREWQLHGTDPMIGVSNQSYRIKLMADQIAHVFGHTPDDLATFALASQIVQAEAKKFFVEIFRQRKWYTSGILWWNMIDCWPQFSDAVVDYYFSRKLAYHYLKRVHAPVCVIVKEPESCQCGVIVSNDSRETHRGTLHIRDADSGETVLETAFESPANENRDLGRIEAPSDAQRLFLIEWETDAGRGTNHYLQGSPPFDLDTYRAWLVKIAALDHSFDPHTVAT